MLVRGNGERDDAMICSRVSSPRVSCGEVTRTITASERVGSVEGGARLLSLLERAVADEPKREV